MYSRQGGIRLPQSSRGNEALTSRRGVRVFGLMFGLCALALMNTDLVSSKHRALSEVRKLCHTLFAYPDWDNYWEDIFEGPDNPDDIYDGSGDRSLLPHEPNNIGYFLTLTSCPEDGYAATDPNDPVHAFYDAAALLKYSIFRNTYPAGSNYNATMYAIVHKSAIMCEGPTGAKYDRVKVLQDLGYHVTIMGSPIAKKNLQDYVKDHIDSDAGDRDFMRLRSLTFDNHPAVVLVDFTTFMMKPMDSVYDDFIANPTLTTRYTVDYPTNLPSTGSNMGPNMHWFMLKPDPAFFDTLVSIYQSTEYDPLWGWNNQGVKDFDGVLGVKGFLPHYFSRVETGKSAYLKRCVYGNDNSDPFAIDPNGDTVCRDTGDCEDCRAADLDSIKVIKLIQTCGKPWECSYDENWDAITKSSCEAFHHAWFSARVSFEETCWLGGPRSERAGTFHPNVFMGFCSCEGLACYESMIPDKVVITSAPIQTPIPVTSQPTPAPTPATSPPTPAPTLAPTLPRTPAPTEAPTLAPTVASVVSFAHATCENFAVFAGTAVTFAANPIQGGDIGYMTALVGAYDLQDGGKLVEMSESAIFEASIQPTLAAALAERPGTVAFSGEIGGLTFTPGTYYSPIAVTTAALSVVTLDGQGDPNAMWLFQGLTLGTAAGSSFVLINGAKAQNVLWALSSAATLGAGSILEGSVISGTAITFGAGAELHGCMLATTSVTFGAAASVMASMPVDVEGSIRHLRGPFARAISAF